ncbi:MAG: NAD(P)H-binding protein [Chitinophagaceae bacterium]|nr:NAD(P)H-binding protein [Chitinophagaceae bacterium]
MKITITGSLGNISRPLTTSLVAAGHTVTVISSSSARQVEIEKLGAKAAIGSVEDLDFLKKYFAGADAVYTMVPATLGGDGIESTVNAGRNYANAIKASGVKRVVMLSSVGADKDAPTGPIRGLHLVEEIFNELDDVSVTFLRPGWFYINFYQDVPLIQQAGILGSSYPGSTEIPMVHPSDVALAAAEELQRISNGKNVRYVVADNRTAGEATELIGLAIGKPGLQWVEFSESDLTKGMTDAGLPVDTAKLYTEMAVGIKSGIVQEDYIKQGKPIAGSIKLEDFVKEFAAGF